MSGVPNLELKSPNENILLEFSVVNSVPMYKLSFKGKEVIAPSKLGFLIKNGPNLTRDFKMGKVTYSNFDGTWEPVLGEYKEIRNNYNKLSIGLEHNTGVKIGVIFQLYNDGLGFRYAFYKQENLNYFIIHEERTEFNLTDNCKAFWMPGDYNTDEYRPRIDYLSEVENIIKTDDFYHGENHLLHKNYGIVAVQTPLLLKSDNGIYINIHEAALSNYSMMQLEFSEGRKFTSHLTPDAVGNKGYIQTDFKTPWRTIIVADDAREIISSQLILNLNEPSVLEDTSWIKPVKYIGVWWEMFVKDKSWSYTNEFNTKLNETDYTKLPPNKTHAANTKNVKRYIDFAAEHGFDQVLVEGWNIGWEDWYCNWKEEVFDFVTPYPDFKLKELTEYAKSKGVRLMMHHETSASIINYERRMDEAYKFMVDNNYNAVKTGYVGYLIPRGEWRTGQVKVEHDIRAVKTAAKYKIGINSHEAVRPTGLCRTYPNWLAQESARGTEFETMGGNFPNHTCILPFTRLKGGPMDYTPGIFQIKFENKPNDRIHTTLAKQLALYVTLYSPLQMAADLPENYERFMDAFQFIKDVALDWDDTKVLEAEPGEYLTIARKTKNKDEWFVGGIANEVARISKIDFSWLNPNRNYKATIYADALDAHWDYNPMAYNIRDIEVNNESVLEQQIVSGGGYAITIRPIL